MKRPSGEVDLNVKEAELALLSDEDELEVKVDELAVLSDEDGLGDKDYVLRVILSTSIYHYVFTKPQNIFQIRLVSALTKAES